MPSFEERLHLAPMTDAEIRAALEEPLPENWTCLHVKGADSVYYWNQETDQTTWLHPIRPAHDSVQHALEVLERVDLNVSLYGLHEIFVKDLVR